MFSLEAKRFPAAAGLARNAQDLCSQGDRWAVSRQIVYSVYSLAHSQYLSYAAFAKGDRVFGTLMRLSFSPHVPDAVIQLMGAYRVKWDIGTACGVDSGSRLSHVCLSRVLFEEILVSWFVGLVSKSEALSLELKDIGSGEGHSHENITSLTRNSSCRLTRIEPLTCPHLQEDNMSARQRKYHFLCASLATWHANVVTLLEAKATSTA